MAEPGQSSPTVADDPLPEALALAQAAETASVGLKLLGGLAVRVLTPDLPPRLRAGQDIDFACLSKGRKKTAAFLEERGCEPDRRNAGLYLECMACQSLACDGIVISCNSWNLGRLRAVLVHAHEHAAGNGSRGRHRYH